MPLALLDLARQLAGGGDELLQLGVEPVVGHQLADRALARRGVVDQPGELVDARARLVGDVGELPPGVVPAARSRIPESACPWSTA